MGLILDTSILIEIERRRFDLEGLLDLSPQSEPMMTSISASELLHGVERAREAEQKARREERVNQILASFVIQPFDLAQARVHARIWAGLKARGEIIGAYDLLIAAAGVALGHEVATLNVREFRRVPGLAVVDGTRFVRV